MPHFFFNSSRRPHSSRNPAFAIHQDNKGTSVLLKHPHLHAATQAKASEAPQSVIWLGTLPLICLLHAEFPTSNSTLPGTRARHDRVVLENLVQNEEAHVLPQVWQAQEADTPRQRNSKPAQDSRFLYIQTIHR